MALAEEGRNNCQMSYTGHGRYSIQMIYIYRTRRISCQVTYRLLRQYEHRRKLCQEQYKVFRQNQV